MATTDPHTHASGLLAVGDGHEIYYEDWGSRSARPIFHLHGGPGANFSDSHKTIYNPKIHRVIFHDQRGAGKSVPFGSLTANTTQDLVADINRLRDHLNVTGPAFVAGGSWGSALALAYAIEHPNNVAGLLIWSIYTMTRDETDWVNTGGAAPHLPEEWAEFTQGLSDEEAASGTAVMKHYHKLINQASRKEAIIAAKRWMRWEASLLSMHYNPREVEQAIDGMGADEALAGAAIELHYFMQNCFVEPNYVAKNVAKIQHIPATIVHGRFDYCTPGSSAYNLARQYGASARLVWVNSGHRRSDPAMLDQLQRLAQETLV